MKDSRQAGFLDGLEPFGTADEIGFKTVGETSQCFGRTDYGDPEGPLVGGVFKATRGTFEATHPFHEHICIHEGEVALTDASGETRILGPGDACFIAKGETVTWDIRSDYMIESFMGCYLDV